MSRGRTVRAGGPSRAFPATLEDLLFDGAAVRAEVELEVDPEND